MTRHFTPFNFCRGLLVLLFIAGAALPTVDPHLNFMTGLIMGGLTALTVVLYDREVNE